MEHHVFAVWDFMCLLKALQRHLTCIDLLWHPTNDAACRRLINSLVLEEESDEIDGVPISHFEVYLQAMREAGANLGPITRFLNALARNLSLEASLDVAEAPAAARKFVRTTFALIETCRPAVVCAAFTLGREQAIPDVFSALLEFLPGGSDKLPALDLYLRRHIELDGEDHGPKALAMLSSICGEDASRWQDATAAAQCALEARIALLSGIEDAIIAAGAPASNRWGITSKPGKTSRSPAGSAAVTTWSGRDCCETPGRAGA
jgi:hypothetical protein